MKSTSQLCFIQFLHPGGEHRPDNGMIKKWNVREHKRKFLENPGKCIRGKETHEGLLHFWGEWEPQSEVIRKIDRPVPHGPRFIYRPYYMGLPRRGFQNTDPFVFGEFLYSGCKQRNKSGKASQLRYLEKGSVILFGSCIAGHFAIDTVFVVKCWQDFRISNVADLSDRVSPTFMDVTLSAWKASQGVEKSCQSEAASSLRLYWGATYESPHDGMFSFFPAAPAELNPSGFSRPVIQIPKVISDVLPQNFKLAMRLTPAQIKSLWETTCQQVEAQGMWLGTYTAEPPKRLQVLG
jgi:hypothetical protein